MTTRPVNHVLAAWDLLTGAYCAFTLVSALMARMKGRGGREIRAPLSDIGAATMANLGFTAETLLSGQQRTRMGNDIFGAFGRDFTTRDGQRLMLLAITPKQWSKALEVLGILAQVRWRPWSGNSACRSPPMRGCASRTGRGSIRCSSVPSPRGTAADLAPAFDAGGVTWGAYQTLDAALERPTAVQGQSDVPGHRASERAQLSGAGRHGDHPAG